MPEPVPDLLLLKDAPKSANAPDPANDVDDDAKSSRAILCRACRHAVTRGSARIEVRGQHEHVCVNPSGIPFDIGCWKIAPGCNVHGVPEAYWSWFDGYRWQVATCGGCGQHLGWAFSGESDGFYGLILSRLLEDE